MREIPIETPGIRKPEAEVKPEPEPEPVSPYGGPQGEKAARELESMGAVVYPPGQGDSFDWSALAGI